MKFTKWRVETLELATSDLLSLIHYMALVYLMYASPSFHVCFGSLPHLINNSVYEIGVLN